MYLQLLEYVSHDLPDGFTPYYIYGIMVDDKEVVESLLEKGQ